MSVSNCRLSARGYGERTFSVSRVEHGMSFVAGGTSTTRNKQWFHNKKVTLAPFSLTATCNSYEDYLDASNWLSQYMVLKSNPSVGDRYGSMRVQIANVNWDVSPTVPFDKTGVLTSAVRYGDTTTSVVYRISMSFSGVIREIDLSQEGDSRVFSQPLSEQDPSFQHFYPFTSVSRPNQDADSYAYDTSVLSLSDIRALLR